MSEERLNHLANHGFEKMSRLSRVGPLKAFVFFAGSVLFSSLAGAQSAGEWEFMRSFQPREYQCTRAREPPEIDGKLDDRAWQPAKWTQDFVDIEGPVRPNPRQATRAKMVWDSKGLYIAAEIQETHLVGTLTEHDCVIFQDNDFEVFIDPDGDHHHYLELELNALNTTWDLYLPRPYKDAGSAENQWEFSGMKTAVHLDGTLNDPSDQDRGWTVEIFLPWSSLQKHSTRSFPPKLGDFIRMNFSRVEWQWEVVDGKYQKVKNTKEDNWVWSPQGIVDMHRPERWGYVVFVESNLPRVETGTGGWIAVENKLMEIYHRQRVFHAQHGTYAKSLQELKIEPEILATLEGVEITTTTDGYLAQLRVATKPGNGTRWRVRQDSKMWSESLE